MQQARAADCPQLGLLWPPGHGAGSSRMAGPDKRNRLLPAGIKKDNNVLNLQGMKMYEIKCALLQASVMPRRFARYGGQRQALAG